MTEASAGGGADDVESHPSLAERPFLGATRGSSDLAAQRLEAVLQAGPEIAQAAQHVDEVPATAMMPLLCTQTVPLPG